MTENIVSANEKYAEAIGYDYGPTSNVVQAAMLSGFAHGLNVACHHKPDTQIAYLVDELTPEARDVFVAIAQTIEAGK
jgi:hypothetical protein